MRPCNRKLSTILTLTTAIAAVSSISSGAAEPGVTTAANEASKTGYTSYFTYIDPEATNVQLTGGFQFYYQNDLSVYANGFVLPANDTQANHLLGPEQWENNGVLHHINDNGYKTDMVRDAATGEWTASLNLPGGSYLYQYQVSYDNGKTYTAVADPANFPEANSYGAHQNRSKFFVPRDESRQSAIYDWGWLTPLEDESQRGSIIYTTYTGTLNEHQQLEIYLPAHYDAGRKEPYKVLYLSHGGGGEEGDWFHQGNAANIADRLAAEGSCEEFLIVCMNNADYLISGTRDWDFDRIDENIKRCVVPYIEANYNVSRDASGRAFAGLSNGAKTTTMLYYKDPEFFSYYGMFSGSAAWAWPELSDYSAMKKPNVYLAAGYADQLMMQNTYHTSQDKTLIGFKELLEKHDISYNNGGNYITVEGAHDWFTWPQIFRDYVSTTLWK